MSAFTESTRQRLQTHYGRAILDAPDDPNLVVFPFQADSSIAIAVHKSGGCWISDYGEREAGELHDSIKAPTATEEDIYKLVHTLVLKAQAHYKEFYTDGLQALESTTSNKAEALKMHRENFPRDWEDEMIEATFVPCKVPSFDPFDL